jgi:GTP pyrophosphokinase
MDDIMVRVGKCCNPIPGDTIKGFITRGRGVTVHTQDCPFIDGADPARIIEAQWDINTSYRATVPIEVISEDRQGVLADITSAISANGTNIINAKIRTTPEKKATCIFDIEIGSLEKLEEVVQAVRKVRYVLKVERLRH